MYCRKCNKKKENFENVENIENIENVENVQIDDNVKIKNKVQKPKNFDIASLLYMADDFLNERHLEYVRHNALNVMLGTWNDCHTDEEYVDMRCFKNSVNIFREANNTDIMTERELHKILDSCITNMTIEKFKNIKIDKKIYILILLILIIFYIKMH